MKNIIVLIGLLFLTISCTRVYSDITYIRPNELGLDDSLRGKIFAINCGGNAYTGASEVREGCLIDIAVFADKKGYKYFTILDQRDSSSTTTKSYTTNRAVTTNSNARVYDNYGNSINASGKSTTYVPQTKYYNETRHKKGFIFLLIDSQERADFDNYYVVSDYYETKKASNNKRQRR